MRNISMLFFMLILLLLSGCGATIHPVKLVDIQAGQILKGQYNESDQSVQVYMPDGEALNGRYSLNRESSITFGSASGYSTTHSSTKTFDTFGKTSLLTNSISNNGQAYAILTGSKGTVMEILVNFTGSSGFGQAVTNKGKRYGVQF